MRSSARWLAAWLGAAALAGPVRAQDSGVAAACRHHEVPASARESCVVVAQAAQSAQPQLGILLAGGTPTAGTASAGGLRLGFLPRVSASARLGLVRVRTPDVIGRQAGAGATRTRQEIGLLTPTLAGTVAVGVARGVDLVPTVGGVGALDLLGSVGWLPGRLSGQAGFGDGSAELSYGAGVRVGLLRESFTLPGVSASWMYRGAGRISYGNVCPGERSPAAGGQAGHVERGSCEGSGDPGEFTFDLSGWSGRAAVSKRLLGAGVVAGVGYDHFRSDVAIGFRAPSRSDAGEDDTYLRARDLTLDSGRWSTFVGASLTALVATLGVEAGWMQGGEPIPGFGPEASEFDPRGGSWFGSLGLRLAL